MALVITSDSEKLFPDDLPEPREADLDRLFAGATRFRLLAGGAAEGEPLGREVLLESDSPGDVAALRPLLRFTDVGFHCMCRGSLALEIHGAEGRRAVLGLHHGVSYRWDDVWRSDARLADPHAVAAFFADRGDRSMRDHIARDENRREHGRREFESWWAAAPDGMPPIGDLCDDYGQISETARATAVTALRERHPSPDEEIRALLHWNGCGAVPWSGFPAYELVPAKLLAGYPLEAVVRVMETAALSATELEGAARLLGGYGFWKGRKDKRALVSPDLRDRLRARVAASQRPENLFRFDQAWKR